MISEFKEKLGKVSLLNPSLSDAVLVIIVHRFTHKKLYKTPAIYQNQKEPEDCIDSTTQFTTEATRIYSIDKR
jgi:hypothetical protein